MNKKILNVSKITGIINLLISVFVFVAINTFLHPCSGEKAMRCNYSTIALFLSLFCIENMKAGISETNRQLSADILIVPSSYDENAKGVLFEGKSCTILFDENPIDTIREI